MKLGNCIKITKILHNIYIKNRYFIRKKSYSMNREDIFVSKFFKFKNNGFYVDVGAYHPLELNNTYLLHKKGWNGINIDINPLSIDYFNFEIKQLKIKNFSNLFSYSAGWFCDF